MDIVKKKIIIFDTIIFKYKQFVNLVFIIAKHYCTGLLCSSVLGIWEIFPQLTIMLYFWHECKYNLI